MPRTPVAVKPKSKARSKRSPSANPKPNEDSESDSDPGPLAKKPKHTTRPASKKREASVKPEPETESSSSDESIYTPPPPKTLKRVSLPEIGRVTKVLRDELGGLNAEEIKLLIRGMRRKSVPARVGVRSDVPKDEEGGLEDEDYVEEEAVLSGDESEDDGGEIQERA